jgi:hypothetical protein
MVVVEVVEIAIQDHSHPQVRAPEEQVVRAVAAPEVKRAMALQEVVSVVVVVVVEVMVLTTMVQMQEPVARASVE